MRSSKKFIYENFSSPGVDEEEAGLLEDPLVEDEDEEAWLLEDFFLEEEDVFVEEVSFRPWEVLPTAGGVLEGPLKEGPSFFCFLAVQQKKLPINKCLIKKHTSPGGGMVWLFVSRLSPINLKNCVPNRRQHWDFKSIFITFTQKSNKFRDFWISPQDLRKTGCCLFFSGFCLCS